MGLLSYANDNTYSRAPSVRLPKLGDSIEVIVDLGRVPEKLSLHDLGVKGKRKCEGDGCKYCAAEVASRTSHVLTVDVVTPTGEVLSRRLWLSTIDLSRLSDELRKAGCGESGTVVVSVGAEEDVKAKTKKKDGSCWTIPTFAVASVERDGLPEDVDEDAGPYPYDDEDEPRHDGDDVPF